MNAFTESLQLQHQFSPSHSLNIKSKKESSTKSNPKKSPTNNLLKKSALPNGKVINNNNQNNNNGSNYNTPLMIPSINTQHHLNLHQQKSKFKYSQYIEIVEQESISVENVTLHNRNSNVHVVVKNTSFVLKIKSLDLSVVNFSNSHLKASLYYACDPLKEVGYIQTPPIQYVGSSSNGGELFTMDIKISILSSQHQGHVFYVMLNITDSTNIKSPITNSNNHSSSLISSLSSSSSHIYLSHPIRVVSKVDHIKKDPNGPTEKKQTFIDILTERLGILESINQSQAKTLMKMYQQRSLPFDLDEKMEYTKDEDQDDEDDSSPNQDRSTKKQRTSNTSTSSNKMIAENFLESFNRVIKVYKQQLQQSNNNLKMDFIGDCIKNLDCQEKSILGDLLGSFTFDHDNIIGQQQQQQHQQQQNDYQQQFILEQQVSKNDGKQEMLESPLNCPSTMSSFHLSAIDHNSMVDDDKCPFRKYLMIMSPIMMGMSTPTLQLSPTIKCNDQQHHHQHDNMDLINTNSEPIKNDNNDKNNSSNNSNDQITPSIIDQPNTSQITENNTDSNLIKIQSTSPTSTSSTTPSSSST